MDCQKQLFSLDDHHHYINGAYMSPMLQSVEEAGLSGLRSKRQPWETTPDDFFEDSNRLRTLFSQLIKAEKAQNTAILPSVSYGLATVAHNIDVSKGQTIVVAGEQFPSNIYIWKRFCKQHGCTLKMIDAPAQFNGRGQKWNEDILDAIDSDTLLVALGNVHWTDGTYFDLDKISAETQSSDAYLIIDGTQSVGALPIDVYKTKIDALICAGYKWLMGPYSMALGYFGERLAGGLPIEEGWLDRKGSEDFAGLINYNDEYQPGAVRYDVGERSNFILVPMMIRALKQIIDWGPQNIQHYCKNLSLPLVQKLPDLGYRIEDSEWRCHHLFGIRLPEHLNPDDLKQQLTQKNIHLSLRGSALRISPNVYNDEEDIEALLTVLSQAI